MTSILKNNIVFLHIPKTGGSWVKKVIQDEGLLLADYSHEHSTYDYFAGANNMLRRAGYISRLKNRRFILNNPKFFCVVRNPITWYESWYKFQVFRSYENWGSSGVPEKWHVMSVLNDLISEDFDQFMENVNAYAPGFVTSLYSMYALNSQATVIRLENIHAEMSDFLTKCGIGISERLLKEKEKVNASPDVQIVWNPEILKQTLRNENVAFLKYGYDTQLI